MPPTWALLLLLAPGNLRKGVSFGGASGNRDVLFSVDVVCYLGMFVVFVCMFVCLLVGCLVVWVVHRCFLPGVFDSQLDLGDPNSHERKGKNGESRSRVGAPMSHISRDIPAGWVANGR